MLKVAVGPQFAASSMANTENVVTPWLSPDRSTSDSEMSTLQSTEPLVL